MFKSVLLDHLCFHQRVKPRWEKDKKCRILVSHLPFWRFQLIPGDNIDQEIKLIKLGDCHGDVIPLQQQREKHASAPGGFGHWINEIRGVES